MSRFYDLKAESPKGTYDFKTLEGKVVLIVNLASQCGFTSQIDGCEFERVTTKRAKRGREPREAGMAAH